MDKTHIEKIDFYIEYIVLILIISIISISISIIQYKNGICN